MRILPLALLLTTALALAGCAADDADESTGGGANGGAGGASEVSGELTVVEGDDPATNETVETDENVGY